jgi:hypothetical protein
MQAPNISINQSKHVVTGGVILEGGGGSSNAITPIR